MEIKETIPKFFKNKDLFFDVITVDGDHSLGGAKEILIMLFRD